MYPSKVCSISIELLYVLLCTSRSSTWLSIRVHPSFEVFVFDIIISFLAGITFHYPEQPPEKVCHISLYLGTFSRIFHFLLSFVYTDLQGLKGITFTVAAGTTTAIVGPTGAGESLPSLPPHWLLNHMFHISLCIKCPMCWGHNPPTCINQPLTSSPSHKQLCQGKLQYLGCYFAFTTHSRAQ